MTTHLPATRAVVAAALESLATEAGKLRHAILVDSPHVDAQTIEDRAGVLLQLAQQIVGKARAMGAR